MTNPNQPLAKIYALFIDGGGERLPIIEQHLGIVGPEYVSIDDRRNQHCTYRALAEKCELLENLLQLLCMEMRTRAFEEATGALDALDFLQTTIATTLWRYHFPLTETLQTFAREFDRLDIPAERIRLYQLAQGMS